QSRSHCERDGLHGPHMIFSTDKQAFVRFESRSRGQQDHPLILQMRASDVTVTTSRFERRLPGGRHKLAFKVAFGSYGAAARALHVSRMTIWRWCHDLSPLPRSVAETLADVIQNKILEVHAAKNHLRDFLALPEKLPRPLSGCCEGLHRRVRL